MALKSVLIVLTDGTTRRHDNVIAVSLHNGFFMLEGEKAVLFLNASTVNNVTVAPQREIPKPPVFLRPQEA